MSCVEIQNGATVHPGDALCTLRNPDLEARMARMARMAGELDAERISLDAIEFEDSTQAAMRRSRMTYLSAGVEEIKNRLRAMELHATIDGTITSAQEMHWNGRFLQQGEELFQIQSDHRFLRIVLTDENVSRARLEIRSVASREEIPLPLTILGGGEVYAWPLGEGSAMAIADQPYLHVLLEVDSVPLEAAVRD